MEFVQYRTGSDDVGRRLDKVLRILFPDTPLSQFYSSLRKGLIRINEKKVRQDYHISEGDVIYVAVFLDFCKRDTSVSTISPSDGCEISCIFRNEHLLFLNKPYDMPVHETDSFKGQTLNRYVIDHYPAKEGSLSFTPGPLHRLDRKTTGIIAFSQSINGARIFTELLKKHEIKKYYLTVVEGIFSEELTFIDEISRDTGDNEHSFHTVTASAWQDEISDGITHKKAITTVKPIDCGTFNGKPFTFAEVAIETGRTHQIRSQCAAHGYPLLGDTAYGGLRLNGFFLHACRLEIPQPNALGLPKILVAPLPERFTVFLEKYLPTVDISLYTESQ